MKKYTVTNILVEFGVIGIPISTISLNMNIFGIGTISPSGWNMRNAGVLITSSHDKDRKYSRDKQTWVSQSKQRFTPLLDNYTSVDCVEKHQGVFH